MFQGTGKNPRAVINHTILDILLIFPTIPTYHTYHT